MRPARHAGGRAPYSLRTPIEVVQPTIAILDGRPANDPGKFGFTRLRLRLRDLNFQGGLHGPCVGNPNIDDGLFDILGCAFADTADYAVDAVQASSTSLHLERPRFVRCNGDLRTETDITTIIGGWSQPLADDVTADRAAYRMNRTVNGQSRYFQRLTLIGWAGIPVLGQNADGSSGWIADTRWVDVRGSFAASQCRPRSNRWCAARLGCSRRPIPFP